MTKTERDELRKKVGKVNEDHRYWEHLAIIYLLDTLDAAEAEIASLKPVDESGEEVLRDTLDAYIAARDGAGKEQRTEI